MAQTDLRASAASLLAWKAAALRHCGDESAAPSYYHRATSIADSLSTTLVGSYFDAISAYHELGGEFEAAYRTRNRQLAGLTGRGRIDMECQCRLERCRLLKRLGRPFEDELSAAREAAKPKNPEPFLAELEAALL